MIDYEPRHWSSHFFDIRGSMFKEISRRVSIVLLASIAVVVAWRQGYHLLFTDKPHAFIGSALALLLVFRTNTSNDRYWEGRKLWGGVVNSTRNLQRKAKVWWPHQAARVAELTEWTISFAWAMRFHLRTQRSLGPNPRLPAVEQAQALASGHPALAAAARMTRVIAGARQEGLLSDIQQVAMDGDVQALVDHLGGCERIMKTPLPYAYVVHLRRALLLYCLTLPVVLVRELGVYTIVATVAVSYVLFGIEEIGTEIENPFQDDPNDLPLDSICGSIEQTLREGAEESA